jgi:hypothetical protein
MPLQSPASYAGFATNMASTSENPVRNHYLHAPERVEEHKADLDDQAKNSQAQEAENQEQGIPMRGVIFDRRYIDLFNAALNNPDHRLRPALERAMQGFIAAADKPEGVSISSAAREFNVPENFFWRWSKQRQVIPIVAEGKGQGSATILDREKVQEVAELYHEAKRQRKQPKKLLESKYPEISKLPKK